MTNKTFTYAILGLLPILLLMVQCQPESPDQGYYLDQLSLPETPYNYTKPDLPEHFRVGGSFLPPNPLPSGASFPDSLPITDAGATLGRVLFYDTRLSLNNRVSCGTCHQQALAFSDGEQFSEGFEGAMTSRNTMSLVNPLTEANFFWDMRSPGIEHVVAQPILNHKEMGMESFEDLTLKLAAVTYYEALFTEAFGDATINKARISSALAMFLSSMVSCHATYDEAYATHFSSFTTQQQAGHALFKTHCANCHGGIEFRGWGQGMANIGLELEYADKGMGARERGMEGVFKIPSLRNVALTAPYMHDGRFQTLEEVIEHYSTGIQSHPNLDVRLIDGWQIGGDPIRLDFTQVQTAALVAFLETLSDKELVNDPKFSNPFQP